MYNGPIMKSASLLDKTSKPSIVWQEMSFQNPKAHVFMYKFRLFKKKNLTSSVLAKTASAETQYEFDIDL